MCVIYISHLDRSVLISQDDGGRHEARAGMRRATGDERHVAGHGGQVQGVQVQLSGDEVEVVI